MPYLVQLRHCPRLLLTQCALGAHTMCISCSTIVHYVPTQCALPALVRVHIHLTRNCRSIFIQMESPMHIWSDTNSLDQHCLIAVFQDVIQDSLNKFLDSWNHHHVPHRGIPAQTYAPCCRWDQLDDASWGELASAGYTRVIANTADLGLIDYDTTGIATVPNDAVARGQVASYDVHDAAEAMALVAGELGALHAGSTNDDMIQFYMTYRALATSVSTMSDWP